MLRRVLLARPVLVLLAAAALLAPGPSHAQVAPPEAARLADCLTIMGEEISTGPAWVEPIEWGWRVVLPLRGQPFADRQVQSPPPAEDTLTWFDLYRLASENQLPAGREMFTSYAMVTPSGAVWYVEFGGYYWFNTNGLSRRCFRLMNDARPV